MKNFTPYCLAMSIGLLVLLGCSSEDDSLTKTQQSDSNSIAYISKSSTDRIAKDLVFKADDFLLTLDVEGLKENKNSLSNKEIVGPYDPEDPTGPTTPSPHQMTMLRYNLIDYWVKNQNILVKMSNELGLEKPITVDQMVDYSESLYFSINDPKRNEKMEEFIKDSPFLNNIQKKYAIELWNASISNDVSALIEIIGRLSKDVKIYPELEIFNFAISTLDILTLEAPEKGSLQQRCPWYHPCESEIKGKNCAHEAIKSATISGVIGMVSGAITGGLTGVTIGAIFGGLPAIPAGGAGAVAGAVYGGVSGFSLGLLGGYITCKVHR